jgi:large subunit ribosomal protein L18
MAIDKKNKTALRRRLRIRNKLKTGTGSKPRISVFRSLKHIYAQIIDDVNGKTLASCSTVSLSSCAGDKKNKARTIGLELAKSALKSGIKEAFLDRGDSRYLGRVAALADGLREGGIVI